MPISNGIESSMEMVKVQGWIIEWASNCHLGCVIGMLNVLNGGMDAACHSKGNKQCGQSG